MSLKDYYRMNDVPSKKKITLEQDDCPTNVKKEIDININKRGSDYEGRYYRDNYGHLMKGFPAMGNNVTNFLVWILIVGIIVYLILYTLKPSWILNPNSNDVDTSKLWLATIGISLLILLLIWLICSARC